MTRYKGRYKIYNDGSVQIKNNILEVGFGQSDNVEIFKSIGGFLYILSTNYNVGYAGLVVFDNNLDQAGEVFIQGDWRLKEIHPRFWDLTGNTQAKYLAQYI